MPKSHATEACQRLLLAIWWIHKCWQPFAPRTRQFQSASVAGSLRRHFRLDINTWVGTKGAGGRALAHPGPPLPSKGRFPRDRPPRAPPAGPAGGPGAPTYLTGCVYCAAFGEGSASCPRGLWGCGGESEDQSARRHGTQPEQTPPTPPRRASLDATHPPHSPRRGRSAGPPHRARAPRASRRARTCGARAGALGRRKRRRGASGPAGASAARAGGGSRAPSLLLLLRPPSSAGSRDRSP